MATGVYFNLGGQADFKHRFRGEEVPMYVATGGSLMSWACMAYSARLACRFR